METHDDTYQPASRHDAPGRDTADYTLTVEEASRLFADGGVPRSERAMQRYCRRGDLECLSVDLETGKKYFISRDSVERRIRELQQIDWVRGDSSDTPDATRRDEPRHDAPGRDTSRQDATTGATAFEAETYEVRIKELEQQNRDIEVEKRMWQQLAGKLDEDRTRVFEQLRGYVLELSTKSEEVGKLKAELRALKPAEPSKGEGGARADDAPLVDVPKYHEPSHAPGDNSDGQRHSRGIE